ncbi:MAG: hypothetical protein OXE95_07040 [Chloroflexi bacterium]|nr:hypothetical protein [Chloroflexota bacterium]MCY4247314.1 hypothetical protein [Chloroflexota bacterium]
MLAWFERKLREFVFIDQQRASIGIDKQIEAEIISHDLFASHDRRAGDIAIPAFQRAAGGIANAKDVVPTPKIEPLAEAVAAAQLDITQIAVGQCKRGIDAYKRGGLLVDDAAIAQLLLAGCVAFDDDERTH